MGGTLAQEDEVTVCVCWMLGAESPEPIFHLTPRTHTFTKAGGWKKFLWGIFFFFLDLCIYFWRNWVLAAAHKLSLAVVRWGGGATS